MTAREFLSRAKNNGALVKQLSNKQIQEIDKTRAAARKKSEEWLNHEDVSNREMRKGTRQNRIYNRVSRKMGHR